MKKITYFPAVLFLFVACSSGKSSTASYIKVIDKGATDNQQWIIAKIGDDNETKELKILVPEKNTWNLFK